MMNLNNFLRQTPWKKSKKTDLNDLNLINISWIEVSLQGDWQFFGFTIVYNLNKLQNEYQNSGLWRVRPGCEICLEVKGIPKPAFRVSCSCLKCDGFIIKFSDLLSQRKIFGQCASNWIKWLALLFGWRYATFRRKAIFNGPLIITSWIWWYSSRSPFWKGTTYCFSYLELTLKDVVNYMELYRLKDRASMIK